MNTKIFMDAVDAVLSLAFWAVVIGMAVLSIDLFGEGMISEAVCLSSVAIVSVIRLCFCKH